MKVLLVGHACAPQKGSEPGVTWNVAWELTRLGHQVWVITHPQHAVATEAFLAHNPRPNLTIEYMTLPASWDPWKVGRGERGLKLHYLMWQHLVLRKARELIDRHGIDVAHHLSFGSVNAAPLLYKLQIPVIWGPIGGGEVMPWKFRRYFQGTLKQEVFRLVKSKCLPLVPSLRRMSRRAAMCLVANLETRRIVELCGGSRIRLAIDFGIPDNYAPDATPHREPLDTLRLLWAGRLEPRKALPLALEALARTDTRAELTVAGDGPLRAQWQQRARELRVEGRVRFLGSVPWETMSRLFRESDAFVFTSLRDKLGTVVLEAMGHGLPILTLNHNGVRCFVPDDCGIKVGVEEPARTVAELAAGIEQLAASAARRREMGAAALAYARSNTARARVQELVQLYEQVTERRGFGGTERPAASALHVSQPAEARSG